MFGKLSTAQTHFTGILFILPTSKKEFSNFYIYDVVANRKSIHMVVPCCFTARWYEDVTFSNIKESKKSKRLSDSGLSNRSRSGIRSVTVTGLYISEFRLRFNWYVICWNKRLYVKHQRQARILQHRLCVPPTYYLSSWNFPWYFVCFSETIISKLVSFSFHSCCRNGMLFLIAPRRLL